jgi:hypothetical protein
LPTTAHTSAHRSTSARTTPPVSPPRFVRSPTETTLALLLNLSLLHTRASPDPAPVILSLSSEVLAHPKLGDWLRQRLTC